MARSQAAVAEREAIPAGRLQTVEEKEPAAGKREEGERDGGGEERGSRGGKNCRRRKAEWRREEVGGESCVKLYGKTP